MSKKTDIADIQFFTLEEVSAKMKITTRSLRRYIKDGKLKAIKFGKMWKVSSEELQRVMQVA